MAATHPRPMDGINTAPYKGRQRAWQDQEEVIADAVRQRAALITRKDKRDARLLVTVLLLTVLLSFSVSANILQGMTGIQVEPYVVRVDHLGNEQPLLKLTELPVTPDETVVIGVLMTWVENVRIIPTDPVILGLQWQRVEDFTSNAALKQLEPVRREQKERLLQLGTRVEICPPRVYPIPKSRSYVVEWLETAMTKDGVFKPEESHSYKATLTVVDFQSKAAKEERELRKKKRHYRNILAVVVDGIKWERRPLFNQKEPPRCT